MADATIKPRLIAAGDPSGAPVPPRCRRSSSGTLQTLGAVRAIWLTGKEKAGIVFETGLGGLSKVVESFTRPRSGCTSCGHTTEFMVVHFVLASSIWLHEGPPLTDLTAIVKARRSAAIFAVVLGFLTGGGRTTARERTCASTTPNSEAWSTRPATPAPRNEERRLAKARPLSSMKIAPGLKHPGPGDHVPPHETGSNSRGRGARAGSARHVAGHEHRARRIHDDHSRQQASRRIGQDRNSPHDGRIRPSCPRDPITDSQRHQRRGAPRALA